MTGKVGQVWEERWGLGVVRVWLVIGREGTSYRILELEEGRLDKVWDAALDEPMDNWTRLA